MRLVCICALACLSLPSAFGEGITIVLDFQGPRSEPSIAEMKREFAGLNIETSRSVLRAYQSRKQAVAAETDDRRLPQLHTS